MSVRFLRAKWSTNCERVALALAIKGIATESVWIDYSDRTLVQELSGQSLVPVLDDGGTVLHDSTAILAHLDATHSEPELYPADPVEREAVEKFIDWFNDQWKQWSNGIESELVLAAGRLGGIEGLPAQLDGDAAAFETLLDELDPEPRALVGDYIASLDATLGRLDGELAACPPGEAYLACHRLTAADLVAFPFLKYATLPRDPADANDLFHHVLDRFQSAEGRPALADWIARIDALPRV